MDNLYLGRLLKNNKSALDSWVTGERTSISGRAVGRVQFSKYFCKKTMLAEVFFANLFGSFFPFVTRLSEWKRGTDARSRLGDISI